MKKLLIIAFLFMYGCASGDKASTKQESATPEDKEFGWIENSDFKKVDEIPFVKAEDLFNDVIGDDSLSSESISRLPESRIERVASSEDPVNKGIGQCYGRNFKKAKVIFEENYEKYKNNPSYWNQIGTCQFLEGKYRKALLFYNKARSLSEKYAPSVNNIGVIHQRLGRDQKALAAFEKAVELNKFSLTPIFNLAQLYLKYGFADKAQRIFHKLNDRNESDVDVLNALGTSYLLKENYTRSIDYFSKIPRSKLSKPEYGLNFSIALKSSGRVKDAKAVFERVRSESLGDMNKYYNKVGRFINE